MCVSVCVCSLSLSFSLSLSLSLYIRDTLQEEEDTRCRKGCVTLWGVGGGTHEDTLEEDLARNAPTTDAIRQHTSEYVSSSPTSDAIRQHTSAHVSPKDAIHEEGADAEGEGEGEEASEERKSGAPDSSAPDSIRQNPQHLLTYADVCSLSESSATESESPATAAWVSLPPCVSLAAHISYADVC